MPVNKLRDGRFTSSEIYRLLESDRVKAAYIEEKRRERVFGGSLDTEVTAKAMSWGKFCEHRLFSLLGLQYEPLSTDTILHPDLGHIWAGTPDLRAKGVTGEIKCFWPKNFVDLGLAIRSQDPERFKKGGKHLKKTYWQAISNAILRQTPEVEIISYMPYESDFEQVQQEAADSGLSEYYWIAYAETPDELPLLPDNSKLDSITTWRFELPEDDVNTLTEAVKAAGETLLK